MIDYKQLLTQLYYLAQEHKTDKKLLDKISTLAWRIEVENNLYDGFHVLSEFCQDLLHDKQPEQQYVDTLLAKIA